MSVAIVTGTSKGIGAAIAEYLLRQGWVVAGCSRTESTIVHSDYLHRSIDVSDEAAVVSWVREVAARHGRIDCLINNAGTASMNHFLTTPVSTLDKLVRVNLAGTFLFSREVGKIMMRRKFGRIVNFSTVAVPLRLPGEAVYAATKAAVEELTRVTARELGIYGITVNAIGPTPVMTDLIKAVPKDKLDELLAKQAIRRLGEYKDILNLIDFFLKPESEFVTGQIIYLGGIG